jgi:hypothetical protein
MQPRGKGLVRLAGGWWLRLIYCERKILLAGWWLVLNWCERKTLLAGNQPAEQGQSGRFKGWCWCPLSNYSRTFTVSLNAVAAHEEAFLAMSGTNRPCIGGLVYF